MNPTIFDDRGKEVPSVAGPYEEGREMKLLCMVSGGECLPASQLSFSSCFTCLAEVPILSQLASVASYC
jgi:hypothetical protein